MDKGWLAFDTITLSSLSEAITARGGQEHKVTAVVSGELAAAGSARLFVKHSSGSVVTLWQDGGGGSGIGTIDAPFTTPAGVSSFQVGTEVVLDQGWLAFNDLTLTAYSDPLPVTAGSQYQAMAQVTGAVTAGVGQGGRILAVYKSGSGQSAGSDVLWRNPLNFSGSTQVQDTFSANTGAATMQLALESDLDAGHLAFSGLGLKHLTASDVIRRSTYSVGGTAVAVKVAGDPEPSKNGIFFLYTDHLGSTSVMSYGYNLNGSLHPQAGQKVAGSEARYLPFSGWRGTTPTAGLTDRGYTGHKSNNLGSNDLGLIYMNARFYAPGTARFISADTLVPNPANPQSFNRYSYVRNSPLNLTDPTGHRECDIATGDCDSRAIKPKPQLPSLVKFEGEWTAEERAIVLSGAGQVSRMLYEASNGQFSSAREAFLAVYGGTVTFEKRNVVASNLGETDAKNHIWVNIQADGYGITHNSNRSMWAAHELSHAFNYALSPNPTDGRNYGQGVIDLATAEVRANVNGFDTLIFGGSTVKTYEVESSYTRTEYGYLPGKGPNGSYQQNTWPNAKEDFGDMFANYSFGSFDIGSDAGKARDNWMESHMSTWINLAVSNNQ